MIFDRRLIPAYPHPGEIEVGCGPSKLTTAAYVCPATKVGPGCNVVGSFPEARYMGLAAYDDHWVSIASIEDRKPLPPLPVQRQGCWKQQVESAQ